MLYFLGFNQKSFNRLKMSSKFLMTTHQLVEFQLATAQKTWRHKVNQLRNVVDQLLMSFTEETSGNTLSGFVTLAGN